MIFCPCGENEILAESSQPAWSMSEGGNLASEYNGWKITFAHSVHHSIMIMLSNHSVNSFFVFDISRLDRIKYDYLTL